MCWVPTWKSRGQKSRGTRQSPRWPYEKLRRLPDAPYAEYEYLTNFEKPPLRVTPLIDHGDRRWGVAGTGVGASVFLIRQSSVRCCSVSWCSKYIAGMARSNRTNSMSIRAA
jgi:hypothetical protein